MGCLNDRVETDKLPTHIEADPIQNTQETVLEGGVPKAVAFQIPNSEIKIRRGKTNHWNKQLYIIREVSNINHELLDSPLKHAPPTEEQMEKVAEELEFQPVQVRQRKRTMTSKEHSTDSKRNEEAADSKAITVDFVPEDIPHFEPPNTALLKDREERQEKRSNRSDNRSRMSNRYTEQMEGLQTTRRKRKGSLSLSVEGGSQPNYRSIHFKRARTFHGEGELVHPVKSVSVNKQKTNAVSGAEPVLVKPALGGCDLQAEIRQLQVSQKNEEGTRLLELYHNLSQQNEITGKYQQALTANAKYLKLSRKLSVVDSCNYGSGLSNLSSIYYSFQNYQKAIQNSMKAQSIKPYAEIGSHMHKARVLNEIGLIELEQNHLKEATHYLQEVREIHGKVLRQFQLDLREMAPEKGSSSKDQYYDRSVHSMEVALRICLRAFGENHLQTASHLDVLGTSYCDAGRYSQSLACFQRCFSIMRCMRLAKHKDYETHSKHFFYILEVMKLSGSCGREVYGQAIGILEGYFPDSGFISDFKERMETSGKGMDNNNL